MSRSSARKASSVDSSPTIARSAARFSSAPEALALAAGTMAVAAGTMAVAAGTMAVAAGTMAVLEVVAAAAAGAVLLFAAVLGPPCAVTPAARSA